MGKPLEKAGKSGESCDKTRRTNGGRKRDSDLTDETTQVTERVPGHVKWFDPVKGFGFVVADEGGPDILLHVNVLRNFGQSSIADGSGVEIAVQRTDRGSQATEIYRIDPPPQEDGAPLADIALLDEGELSSTPLQPARVKWFDKAKGFGFANVFGKPEDVFLHVEVLRRSGLSDLQPGEALALRVVDGKRGRMAAEVVAWEAGLAQSDD